MQPKTNGVWGRISLAVAMTLAMSVGFGGSVAAISVPRMGMKAITTTAEGLFRDIISKA